MKKILPLLFLALAVGLTACSKDESPLEKVSQKVDQINTDNANTAVQAIKSPINKARATQDLGEERTGGVDQAMQNLSK